MSERLPYPVSVMVTRNVEETLARVANESTYLTDLTVERAAWKANTPKDYLAVVHLGDPEEVSPDESALGFKYWRRTYSIQVYVPDSETPGREHYDELIDIAAADIHHAMMQDDSRGGFALSTEPRAPRAFIDSDNLTGVVVDIEVLYRHALTDPYRLA